MKQNATPEKLAAFVKSFVMGDLVRRLAISIPSKSLKRDDQQALDGHTNETVIENIDSWRDSLDRLYLPAKPF